MNWREAAAAFAPLEEKDIAHMQLSKEEKEQVISLFNKAESNAQTDSADIAMIALKKLLTQYPTWGEAALLYGICLAIDGKYKRAAASFQHAISTGLQSEDLTYMAQVCMRDAGAQYTQEKRSLQPDEETGKKSAFAFIKPGAKSRKSVYKEIDSEERGHMQAPILTRVPRSTGKTKMATDRERRDIMMQANAPGGDSENEEIDISIPKTPAEKLRIAVIAFGSVVLAALLGFTIWYIIIPGIASIQNNKSAAEKLDYLLSAMAAGNADPEVSQILEAYQKKYQPEPAAAQTGQTESPAIQSDQITQVPQKEATVPAGGATATPAATGQPSGQETSAAPPDTTGTIQTASITPTTSP